MKVFKNISPYIVIIGAVILAAVLISSLIVPEEISYTNFVKELTEKNVKSVTLEKNAATIVLKEQSKTNTELTKLKYTLYISDDGVFEEAMRTAVESGNDVQYNVVIKQIPFIIQLLPYILLGILFIVFMYVLLTQNQGGSGKALNFGRSRARLYTSSKITFNDVAGAVEEKEELAELVSFLKDPKKYSVLGARIPKGVLMVGPPGTGKTYLAKAVAGEAKVPFFSISGSDFVEMYVGVGASRVRDLFEQAKKNSPCIVFIDEIDAVGRHRGAGLGGGHDEREQTLNQLLVEMDGFGINEGVIVMAATNRPDILDPALTRPGRFDRKVVVGYPDIKGREAILAVHAKNKPLEENVSLSDIAKTTSGFTAADLENLLNEAALLAARNKKDKIGNEELKEATFKVIVGPEKKSRVLTEKSKWLTAVHEAGHAVVVKRISSTDKVDRISIIPAGYAGGYTSHRPEQDEEYSTKSQLIEDIVICLGGKAAEEIIINEISTGATSDLKQANAIAFKMVTHYGMSEKIGNMFFDSGSNEVFIGKDLTHTQSYSQEMAASIDREVKSIIDSAYDKAKQIITENKVKLDGIAHLLLEKERIEGDEFEAFMNA